jgi:molybdopterin-guanine dinucleotide biosynthesis protein A
MGSDKAGLLLQGVAAATRIARLLDSLCDEVLLVGGEAPSETPGRAIRDPEGPRCALRGLVGALAGAREERVLVIATDLPLVSARLLRGLLSITGADAVVPRSGSLPQPLCALYHRSVVLPQARAHLASGRLALRALLDALHVEWIEGERLRELDPDGSALLNVNTPEEQARAEALLRTATL